MTHEIYELLSYDPVTGILCWKVRTSSRNQIGGVAGGRNANGYVMVSFKGRKYPAHRIAWRIMTGRWPAYLIDHKNLDRADNRWVNLREATHLQNNANCPPRTKSPHAKGVTLHKKGRYQAQIKAGGRNYYLGLFDTAEEANAAYAGAAKVLFGEFARAA